MDLNMKRSIGDDLMKIDRLLDTHGRVPNEAIIAVRRIIHEWIDVMVCINDTGDLGSAKECLCYTCSVKVARSAMTGDLFDEQS